MELLPLAQFTFIRKPLTKTPLNGMLIMENDMYKELLIKCLLNY